MLDLSKQYQGKYITTVNKPISVSSIPINLGFVIKAEKLLDFKPILKNFLEKNRE